MSETCRKPLMPLEDYERIARVTWTPFFKEDAVDSDHRMGWKSLVSSAKKSGVSTTGFVWNSKASKLRLAKRLMQAKLSEVRTEWSQKISTGLYEVIEASGLAW
jgi:hypothetical protein